MMTKRILGETGAVMVAVALVGCTVLTTTEGGAQATPGPVYTQSSGGAVTTAPAQAQPMGGDSGFTLRQQNFINTQNEYFQRSIDDFNQRCESTINARIDWASFREEIDKQLDGEIHYSFYGYCGEALGAMASMCSSSDASKGAIQARIREYTCHFGGEGQRSMSLEGNHLHMSVDWEATNYWPFVEDFLGRHL